MRIKNEVRFTLRIAPKLNALLVNESKETGLTKNGLIVQAILDRFRKKQSLYDMIRKEERT